MDTGWSKTLEAGTERAALSSSIARGMFDRPTRWRRATREDYPTAERLVCGRLVSTVAEDERWTVEEQSHTKNPPSKFEAQCCSNLPKLFIYYIMSRQEYLFGYRQDNAVARRPTGAGIL